MKTDINILNEFQNDVLYHASDIMNPVWNGNPNKAYILSNEACQIIDMARIYGINACELTIPEQWRRIANKLRTGDMDRLLRNNETLDKTKAFINKWRERTNHIDL